MTEKTTKYKNKEWLTHQYCNSLLTMTEIGKLCGVYKSTIFWWMEKFGIPRRGPCGYRRGNNHPMWKGGHMIDGRGYLLVKSSKHPHIKDGYVKEHRLVAEAALGRYLKPNEHVHHIDGNRQNNQKNNLVICHRDYHLWLHRHRIPKILKLKELGVTGKDK